ncbi:SAYSvFN domain-containing protein 1 [Astyanax mexicanus]|uniref:SAYSvFN domain-containing protein 1 n=2 Tax=Astyanax mexicanus TaxID=7994 RepID=A0A8B9LKV7_ASTMX|nr:SAYSvFN domain-containing protein 1 [Astyanax mexicanus]KAG9283156.1 SAYSvFN domain-containing protein 1 [Astyanax mexicanus]
MEQKLAEFRARRRAEANAKENLQKDTNEELNDQSNEPAERPDSPETQRGPHTEEKHTHQQKGPDWLLDSALGRWLGVQRLAFTNLTLLKVLLWLVLLGLFSELDFGLPFFLISLFYWLYEGLRSPTVRQPGELSAYSVFNPDCQPILGTLTAEQLEGEMGYRPMANRVRS